MILNVTNSKTIEKVHKTPYIEDWVSKQVLVKVVNIRAFGEQVDAVRVIERKPAKIELTPKHKAWDAAKLAIESKANSIDQIKKKYSISPENEKILCGNLK